jgi:hypothetical protein
MSTLLELLEGGRCRATTPASVVAHKNPKPKIFDMLKEDEYQQRPAGSEPDAGVIHTTSKRDKRDGKFDGRSLAFTCSVRHSEILSAYFLARPSPSKMAFRTTLRVSVPHRRQRSTKAIAAQGLCPVAFSICVHRALDTKISSCVVKQVIRYSVFKC